MAWSPLQELVTLDQVKQRLKLPLDHVEEDDDLQLHLEVAHEIVMDFVAQRISDRATWQATVDSWTSVTAPKRIKAAILIQTVHFYRFRGDDNPNEVQGRWKAEVQGGYSGLLPEVVVLLSRLRDPAIA